MGYEQYLADLLAPLGVYKKGGINGGELSAQGGQLDDIFAALTHAEREMLVETAEDTGLEAVERLLAHRPAAPDLQHRRAALAALLRVGGDSFTLKAINDNLKGCGLNAVAAEAKTPQTVEVRFPDVAGIPDGFPELQAIIEEILPCHLGIRYIYWYLTWEQLEKKIPSWAALEAKKLTWEQLEKLVR